MKSLIDRNVTQGALISCHPDSLSPKFKGVVEQSRCLATKRTKPVLDEYRLLVLSQNCDIANDSTIELLAIRKVKPKKLEEKIQRNRNYRKLQLPVGEDYWLCEADLISIVSKEELMEESISVVDTLSENSRQILVDWRTSRYSRRPLPDGFNKAFIISYLKAQGNQLDLMLEKFKEEILDLFVYVSPKDEENADIYKVSLTAVLCEDCDDGLVAHIQSELEKHCRILHDSDNCLNMIQISGESPEGNDAPPLDKALKASEFTLLDAHHMTRLNLDYLCYSDESDEDC